MMEFSVKIRREKNGNWSASCIKFSGLRPTEVFNTASEHGLSRLIDYIEDWAVNSLGSPKVREHGNCQLCLENPCSCEPLD